LSTSYIRKHRVYVRIGKVVGFSDRPANGARVPCTRRGKPAERRRVERSSVAPFFFRR
jgi:hypothetical protein